MDYEAMDNTCSWTTTPTAGTAAALGRIWRVDVGADYDNVVRWPAWPGGLVAVRTLGGEGQVELANERVLDLPSASAAVLVRDHIRRYRTAGDAWRFWWLEFEAVGPLPLPRDEVLPVPVEPAEEPALQQCFDWLHRSDHVWAVRASAELAALLHDWAARGPRPAEDSADRRRVERAMEIMRSHLDNPISMRELAERLGVSDRWLREGFRAIIGRGPKACYDAMRLQAAAEMLRMGGMSVSQVADRLGYSSPFHLSRAFKAHHGVPPSAVRGS